MTSAGYDEVIRIPIEPLTPQAFAPFGTVIQNPTQDPSEFPSVPTSVSANQGTATKFIDVSALTNHYGISSSRKPAEPKVSMFVCSPRELTSSLAEGTSILPYPGNTKTLRIPVLERHPYTSQTFLPLGLNPSDRETAYIVLVAPTLPSRSMLTDKPFTRVPPYPTDKPKDTRRRGQQTDIYSRARPEPFTNSYKPSAIRSDSSGTLSALVERRPSRPASDNRPAELKDGPTLVPSFASLEQYRARAPPLTEGLYRTRGNGRPDLRGARAFVAHGGQGVTYAPGTWHAPMAVVGKKNIEFVVWQWANGVEIDDVQEVQIGKPRLNDGEDSMERVGQSLEVVLQEGTYGVRTGQGVAGVKAKI